LQQKLLGPIVLWPAGQFEFEQAAFAASVATEQHLPLTWMPGRGQAGTHAPLFTSRN
jgi:hypothetical protein